MKKNILLVIFIIIGMIVILIFSDHNLKKTISACIVGQLRTAELPDVEKAKKFWKSWIMKKLNDALNEKLYYINFNTI